MSPTRTFALLLAVVAIACGAAAFLGGDNTRAASSSDPALTTALWSPRRVPQPIVDAVGAQRLQAALTEAAAGVDACFVVDDGGAPLAIQGVDTALIPASTEKLVTAAAALAVLGPDARLVTRAAAAKAVENGAVDQLFLIGGGDPLLVTPEAQAARDEIPELRGTPTTSMASLADAIKAAGITRIPGGIVADDSRYETLRYLPTWKDSYRTDGQVGPLGALTVNGGFSQLRPPKAVDDPAIFAAEELGRLLKERGVSVGKAPSLGTAPAGAVDLAKVDSPAMTEILTEDLSTSNNLASELLVREIGLKVSQQGTTAAGTQAITAKLAELGLPTTNVTVVDGSGLDRGDRQTCSMLAAALNLGSRPEYSVLWNGLSVAGQRGTLVDQLPAELAGKVRGKTGTLDGVTGLVGIVDVNRPLRFAFLASGGFTEEGGIGLRGRIAEIIARFPDAPAADLLVPAPASSPSTTTTAPSSTP